MNSVPASALDQAMEKPAPLVAHIIYKLDVGGLENGLINLINRSRGRHLRHAIICVTGATEFRKRLDGGDVRIEEIGKRPGKDPGHYRRVWRILRSLRPQILHTRNLATLEYQWLGWLAGIPVRIHGEHGWDAADLAAQRPRGRLLRRATGHIVDRYVAMSRDLARWLEREVGIDRSRVVQLYNGVDLGRFRRRVEAGRRDGTPFNDARLVVIGSVGRVTPIKDQASLVQAFAILTRTLPRDLADRLRLAIVGDGPLLAELRRLADSLQLADRVWMPGSRDDVPELLAAMDVFALPSLNEGISNTILEAMAVGLPVVATNVGGNSELVIDGETGRLCAPGNAEELAVALRPYIENEALRAAQGAAGRSRIERHFALERMVEEYLALYESLLARLH